MNINDNTLKIEHLKVDFKSEEGSHCAVNDVSLKVRHGVITGLIGESGCGKTLTALSAMGLLPNDAEVSGSIYLDGKDVIGYSEEKWQSLRGKDISMIFQEPLTSLNPLMTVGRQIEENIKDKSLSRDEKKNLVYAMMEKCGLTDVKKLYKQYPHKLSGGMRQRIMIAMSLINNPDIVIADEPTTALDVTIQAQIIDLIRELNRKTETAVLFISHDLALVSELCEEIYIMYAGKIVEHGKTEDIINNPLHPYTKGLINAIPDIKKRGERLYNIEGFVPSIEERSEVGCPFHNRCESCMEMCSKVTPAEKKIGDSTVYCHLFD